MEKNYRGASYKKIIENEEVKFLWDIDMQCNHEIEAKRSDIVLVNKTWRCCLIIDVAVLEIAILVKRNARKWRNTRI